MKILFRLIALLIMFPIDLLFYLLKYINDYLKVIVKVLEGESIITSFLKNAGDRVARIEKQIATIKEYEERLK